MDISCLDSISLLIGGGTAPIDVCCRDGSWYIGDIFCMDWEQDQDHILHKVAHKLSIMKVFLQDGFLSIRYNTHVMYILDNRITM